MCIFVAECVEKNNGVHVIELKGPVWDQKQLKDSYGTIIKLKGPQ